MRIVGMDGSWGDWKHVVKLDPDKELRSADTYSDVCASGTDAVMIGGTTGVTREKIQAIIDSCEDYDIPLYQEPNSPDVVVNSPELSGYLVPIVLNAGDVFWIVGAHKEGIKHYPDLPWELTTPEAYIVLNADASVAQYTQADCTLDADDVTALSRVAEQFLCQQIVYLEYSGQLGDPNMVKTAQEALTNATLFYGGGIHDYDSAFTMAEYADVIVVGNLLYESGVDALRETVRGAKDAQTHAG